MSDASETSAISDRRSFSAASADVSPRSAFAASLNLADAGETKATNQPTFHDLLDAINPLQHIPVVSWLYRQISGDQISAQARIAGDAIYGGIAGLVSGMFNALVEKDTGKDIAGNIVAFITGKSSPPAATATAATAPAAPASPAAGSTSASGTAAAAATPATTTLASSALAAPATANAAPNPPSPAPSQTAPSLSPDSQAALAKLAADLHATPANPTANPAANPPTTPQSPAAQQPAAQQPAAQPLSAGSQAALARLAADLHTAHAAGVTPASFMGAANATPAVATSANGTPLPARPVLAARAGGNNGSPSGLSLMDYRKRPIAEATMPPQPTPTPAGVNPSQATASYAQALEMSRQIQNYYQGGPTAAPAAADAAAP